MDDRGRLGAAIAREMVEIDREADGVKPAELRVGLDSIDARRDRTTRFVGTFEPPFDVVIERRVTRRAAQRRHLRDVEPSSEWFPL